MAISRIRVSSALVALLCLSCINLNVRSSSNSSDDDDGDVREPRHDTDEAESAGETDGSGEGDRTGDASEGESYSYAEGDSTLYVVNLSGLDILELYVTPCSADSWGEDLLELADWLLPDGWYFWLTGLDAGCYDIEAWDLSGDYWWDQFGAQIDGEYTLILLPPEGGGGDDDDDDDDDVADDDDFSEDCDEDEIEDCNGNCAPLEWWGDGECDEGQWDYDGVPIYFDCDELDWDDGDCLGGDDDDDDVADDDDAFGCADDEIEDCNGLCAPESYLGDGVCDDGTKKEYDLYCEEWNWDEGDCD